MLPFQNKILFVGYGAVAECTLPILFKHLKVPAKNVTVMDFVNKKAKLAKWIKKGVRYLNDRVTESNMATLLAKHVGPGDILIDLAWNIDACEILQWCHDNGVRYINTSTELWDPYKSGSHPTEKTLYWRHMNLRKMLSKWPTKGPTAVIEHGRRTGHGPLGNHLAQVHVAPVERHLLRRGIDGMLIRIPEFHRGVDVEHAFFVAPSEDFAGVNVPGQINQHVAGGKIFAEQRAHVFARHAVSHELHAALDPRGERRLAVLEIHHRDVFGRGLDVLDQNGQGALGDGSVADEQDFIFEWQHDKNF